MAIWVNILDILFPRCCSGCGTTLKTHENYLCVSCLLNIPQTYSHIVLVPELERKFAGKINVKNTYSFLKYTKNSIVQQILHELKYRNKPELARFLGALYAKELVEAQIHQNIDVMVAVPLHPDKLKIRGYNQSDAFAMGLSEGMGIAHEYNLLVRDVFTETQTRKSRFARFKNTEGVFSISDSSKIAGKRVALLDDVLTTGSTLESAGEVLLKNGCSELTIITIALAY